MRLRHAVGGRIADRKLSEHLGDPFFFDRAGSNRVWIRSLRWLKPVTTDRFDASRPFLAEMVQPARKLELGAVIELLA